MISIFKNEKKKKMRRLLRFISNLLKLSNFISAENLLVLHGKFKIFIKSEIKFQNINRYVTKIKNCSGFSRVDQFLKVWSLLSPKIIISPKSVELRLTTARTPATLPVHNDPQLKFFSNPKFIECLEFFGKPAS
jgi:hypothetical protein